MKKRKFKTLMFPAMFTAVFTMTASGFIPFSGAVSMPWEVGVSMLPSDTEDSGSSEDLTGDPFLAASYMAGLPHVDIEESPVMEVSAYDNRVIVTSSQYLNIRQEPSSDSPVVGKIFHGSSADILERQDNWTKISSGSVSGWVSNDYILTGSEAQAYEEENAVLTATVKTDYLNVREKPNTESRILATVRENQMFIVEEQAANWIKIFYTSGIQGYISSEYVEVLVSQGTAVSVEEEKTLTDQIIPETEAETEEKEEESKKKQDTKETSAAQTETKGDTSSETQPADSVAASYDDVTLLAALAQAEAGYDYEGCLAVASVVMNRVNSPSYPNSIREVIYQKGQFSPASSGMLDKILLAGPSSTATQAAAAAMSGENNIGDYLRFTPSSAANIQSYNSYVEVGGNVFFK